MEIGRHGVWIAVAALVIGLAGGVVISRTAGDDDAEVLGVQQSPTPRATATPSPEAEESPDATDEAEAQESPVPTPFVVAVTPAPTSRPANQPTSTTSATEPTREAPPRPAEINCTERPELCSSSSHSMVVSGGELESQASSQRPIDREASQNNPTFTMISQVQNPDAQPAQRGDRVSVVVIETHIVNETNRTFVFPEGEVGIHMTRDGERVNIPVARQGYFEMPPNGELLARFEVPITRDGQYDWVAKTWFYEK